MPRLASLRVPLLPATTRRELARQQEELRLRANQLMRTVKELQGDVASLTRRMDFQVRRETALRAGDEKSLRDLEDLEACLDADTE